MRPYRNNNSIIIIAFIIYNNYLMKITYYFEQYCLLPDQFAYTITVVTYSSTVYTIYGLLVFYAVYRSVFPHSNNMCTPRFSR